MMSAPILSGLSEIFDDYDAFILDIFGVIHDGIRPFSRTIECLERLQEAGKKVCLLSNSPRRAQGAAAQMESMGIGRDLYNHIVTSGEATHEALSERGDDLGDDCWFIGNALVSEIVSGQNLNLLDGPENASFILNSIPGTEASAVEILKRQLQVAVKKGLPMICANPDLVVNIGSEQFECAGTFAAYYETLGGRVVYHGKPHAPVYEQCHALLGGIDKARICAVGDSFHTDIAGANAFGIDSVMNLVGIHQEELRDFGVDNLLGKHTHKPTYLMNGFGW